MINASMFHHNKESAEMTERSKKDVLKTRLQSLLNSEGEMMIDDDLVDHCFMTSVYYVNDQAAANDDVLKYFQTMSKNMSTTKNDSVEQAPFTNIAKIGYDFMMSLQEEVLFKGRTHKILEIAMAVQTSTEKMRYYENHEKTEGHPYTLEDLKSAI